MSSAPKTRTLPAPSKIGRPSSKPSTPASLSTRSTPPPSSERIRRDSSNAVTVPDKNTGNVPPSTSGVLSSDMREPGTLGSIVDYGNEKWRVLYVGPVYFAEGVHLGLECCDSQRKSGNCNGTIDNVKYFVCDEDCGVVVPRDAILGVPEQQDRLGLGSITESIVGGTVQCVRKLRDVSLEDSDQQLRVAPPLKLVHVGVETDVFIPHVVKLPSTQALMADVRHPDGKRAEDVFAAIADHVTVALAQLKEAADRVIKTSELWRSEDFDVVQDILNGNQRLQEEFDWSVHAESSGMSSRTCPTEEEEENVNQGLITCSVPLRHTLVQILNEERAATMHAMNIRRVDVDAEVPPDVKEERGLAAWRDEMKQLAAAMRLALLPCSEYLQREELRLEPEAVFDTEVESFDTCNGVPALVTLQDQKEKREQFRRAEFDLQRIELELQEAVEDGRVEEVEMVGHKRLEAARAMQKLSCELLRPYDELHESLVSKPRCALRAAIASSQADLNEVIHFQESRKTALAASTASVKDSLELERDRFIRQAYDTSLEFSRTAATVAQLHQEETDAMDQLQRLIERLHSIRQDKLAATVDLHAKWRHRQEHFARYHQFREEVESQLIGLSCRRQAVDSAHSLSEYLNTSWLEHVSNAEEAVYMTFQRKIFEQRFQAHEMHQSAYRQLCLASEDLHFRKQQAHRLICDRLDRCTAELEIAMDSLDERSKGLVKEKNELDRIAKEMYEDLKVLDAIQESSSDVFQQRTAAFFIECGRDVLDPRLEAKMLTEARKKNLLAITDTLRSAV